MNELFLLLIQYHLLLFTNLVDSVETRVDMGLSCVVMALLNIALNLIINLAVILYALKLQAKRQYNRHCMKQCTPIPEHSLAHETENIELKNRAIKSANSSEPSKKSINK